MAHGTRDAPGAAGGKGMAFLIDVRTVTSSSIGFSTSPSGTPFKWARSGTLGPPIMSMKIPISARSLPSDASCLPVFVASCCTLPDAHARIAVSPRP